MSSTITKINEFYEYQKKNIIKEQEEKKLNEIKRKFLLFSESEKYLSRISHINESNPEHKKHYDIYFSNIEKVILITKIISYYLKNILLRPIQKNLKGNLC